MERWIPGFGINFSPRDTSMVRAENIRAIQQEAQQPLGGFSRAARVLIVDRRAKIGTALLIVMASFALIGVFFTPQNPEAVDTASRLQGPSAQHWMGTDRVGRDVLSRIMSALHISLTIAAVAVAIAVIVGVPIGAFSGFTGGWMDAVIMRVMDAVIAFPSRLIAIVLVVVLGPTLFGLWFAIAFGSVPVYARLIRGGVLAQKEREYVEAAYGIGESKRSILYRYILPNSMTPVIVRIPLNMGAAIIAEATLSFLGLGLVPPTISLGQMLSASRQYLEVAPWLMVVPAVVISAFILCFVLLGDSLRDHLDPRHQ
jgi:peptide/nickel transport system permease protein